MMLLLIKVFIIAGYPRPSVLWEGIGELVVSDDKILDPRSDNENHKSVVLSVVNMRRLKRGGEGDAKVTGTRGDSAGIGCQR